ncbi:MAG: trigger factor, partial [Bacteroidales bacterium]|nr:trigger factor [Bacteroidales bacterium]
MDKETRKALIAKYLEAETSPEEERRLRDWFAVHAADEDEREFALLVGLSAPCGHCLPETDDNGAEEEFDRIVLAGESRRH